MPMVSLRETLARPPSVSIHSITGLLAVGCFPTHGSFPSFFNWFREPQHTVFKEDATAGPVRMLHILNVTHAYIVLYDVMVSTP